MCGSQALTLDAQIATQKRLAHIHMLDVDLHIIHLTIGLLSPAKLATGAEE